LLKGAPGRAANYTAAAPGPPGQKGDKVTTIHSWLFTYSYWPAA